MLMGDTKSTQSCGLDDGENSEDNEDEGRSQEVPVGGTEQSYAADGKKKKDSPKGRYSRYFDEASGSKDTG
jgi:hypothetical protein